MNQRIIKIFGIGFLLGLTLLFSQVSLGQQTVDLQDVQVTAMDQGIHFHLTLPEGNNFTQANLEYWNGQIFEDAEQFKTNYSFSLKPNQKSLDFNLKDDPRIELIKRYLAFVLYFHFRFTDKNGNILDAPEMVYYVNRTWYVKPAGSMVFFAQRRGVYWDRLPQIADTITKTVDNLYGLKQKKVFVLLYKNQYALAHDSGMPGWAAALFSYNIWMRDNNTETRFVAEMAHEYTHYLQYENNSRIPLFFMEGMGDYTYFKLAPLERPDLSLFRTILDEGHYLDSTQMFGQYPQEEKYINSFYKQGYLFVQYVADKLGPEKFKQFIQGLNSKALDQVVAQTPEFSKMGLYGMWMEIRDQVTKASPRSKFLVNGKYPDQVSLVKEGWKGLWGLSFSTDSQKAAVGERVTDKDDNPISTKLEILDLKTGKIERSRDIKFAPVGLRWSPTDPDRFMTFVPKDEGEKIGLFSWRDRDYKVIGQGNENIEDARWSPDGKRIAFTSDHSGAFELYIMNADGTKEEQITKNIGYISSFNWLPDGKGFLLVSNQGGNDILYRLTAPEYKPEIIPTANYYRLNAPALSPDGQKIALFAYSADFSESNLVLINLNSKELTQLTQGANISFVRWLDNQNLLFGNYNEDKETTAILRFHLTEGVKK